MRVSVRVRGLRAIAGAGGARDGPGTVQWPDGMYTFLLCLPVCCRGNIGGMCVSPKCYLLQKEKT